MILKRVFLSVLFFLLSVNLVAQDIEAKLSGATDTQGFTVRDNASNSLFTVRGNGNAGLGTVSPVFRLSLEKDGGILAKGTYGSGTRLPSNIGPVMIWYPRKAAFRAGSAASGTWDDANVGYYSFASGDGTTASGYYSTAMGRRTTASRDFSTAMGSSTTANGKYSTAMGSETTASGFISTAMGRGTTASGYYSTAMGYSTTASDYSATSMGSETTASGYYSTAMGYSTTASGFISTALGSSTTASGSASTAMGYSTTASGSASTAMGYSTTASGRHSIVMGYKSIASGEKSMSIGSYVSTNGKKGSIIFGDASTTTVRNAFRDNRFYAFFDGGYYLITNGTGGYCVYLNHNDNSWRSCSDSTKKENYQAVDGEDVLRKFSAFRLGSWNYKGQDAARYRHYGAMAQEWFTAFGHDSVGLIGNDTSLSSADVDGIAYIAIQALERRTAELRQTTAELIQTTAKLREKTDKVETLKEELTELQTRDEATQKQLEAMRIKVSEMDAILKKYAAAQCEGEPLKSLLSEANPDKKHRLLSGN